MDLLGSLSNSEMWSLCNIRKIVHFRKRSKLSFEVPADNANAFVLRVLRELISQRMSQTNTESFY